MATGTLPTLDPRTVDPPIPTANIRPAERDFPDDTWLNIPNVPVFAEHATTTTSGRRLSFGREELAAVCANCNRRIRETGDYAGIVVGHTPDPQTAPSSQMPLVGLAGPFRLGLIQQPGGPPKWAILADFHINRKHAHVIQDYPRRSPELWIEDRYEDMYLDPIALLGAEAPRLDMGLLYSAVRRRDGKQIEKYSACAPAATTVFAPTADVSGQRRDYAAQSAADPTTSTPGNERTAMPFTPEDLKQIVDALEQQPWVQWVKQRMKAETPPEPPPEVPSPEQGPAQAARQRYGAEEEPTEPVIEPPTPAVDPTTAAQPTLTKPGDDEPLPVKYSRLANQVGTLRQTVEVLRGQLDQERAKRINTERYSALAERRRTRLFELDAEFERCKYGKMSDHQFAEHLDLIDSNYREIPLDTSLPTFDLPAAISSERPGGKGQREKYSKEVADKALAIAKRKAMAGEPVSYEEVLEQVATGKL